MAYHTVTASKSKIPSAPKTPSDILDGTIFEDRYGNFYMKVTHQDNPLLVRLDNGECEAFWPVDLNDMVEVDEDTVLTMKVVNS